MNGTEKIIARILSDADAKNEKTLESVRASLAEGAAKTEAECTEILARAKAEAEKNAESILSRAESSATTDARRALLLAKAEMLDRAYLAAEKTFLEADDETRMRFCIALTASAVDSVLKEEEELLARYGEERTAEHFCVILSEKDRASFGDAFIKEFLASEGVRYSDPRVASMTLSEAGGTFGTGIVLSCGEYEHNATLAMLLAAHRNDCEQEVYSLLFPSV